MDQSRPKRVLVTRKLPEKIEKRMSELFDVTLNPEDRPYNQATLKEALKHTDILVPTVTDHITKDILEEAGQHLSLIANYGAGIDHIDLNAAQKYGILVTNTPGVLTEDTADCTLALILSVPRRLAEGERLIRADKWTGWAPTHMMGHRVTGKKLGIIGMGRIGQAVAKRAQAFNLSINYHNRHRVHPETEAELGATYWPNLDDMLSQMDILSIHCPNSPSTTHLLDRRRLALLQPHAILINTSRGQIIEEEALAEALLNKKFAGAGLDVFEKEPAIHPKLIGLDNVVLLPHLGSATYESRQEMGERVLINIQTHINGHTPPDRVVDALKG